MNLTLLARMCVHVLVIWTVIIQNEIVKFVNVYNFKILNMSSNLKYFSLEHCRSQFLIHEYQEYLYLT